jgi:hypothetical protein
MGMRQGKARQGKANLQPLYDIAITKARIQKSQDSSKIAKSYLA